MALTAATIRNAKPKEKAWRLFDGHGLYLEVSPGGGKHWRWKYRVAGREKRESFGSYPEVSLLAAREKLAECRRALRSGIDPADQRKAAKQTKATQAALASDTFEAISREWYAARSKLWRPNYGPRILARLERDVFPWLGALSIAEVDAPTILGALRRIEARAPETAHRTLSNLSQVFRYAVATARAARDPTGDLRGALTSATGAHFTAITDPAALAEVLRSLDGYQGSFVVQSALRLAPLLFVRPGELRHAEWAAIDLDAGEWRFSASKTETQILVPLARQSVAILRALHPLTGRGRFVFPSARGALRPMSDNAVLGALRRLDIPKETMTGHGFRATARTILDEVLGFPAELIEQQLGHAVRDPLGRAYNRTTRLPERVAMMQRWADYLDELKASASPPLAIASTTATLHPPGLA